VLLIGAETFSTIIDPADRGTAVIFGDGAGAIVLAAGRPGESDQLGEVGPCVLGSDGSRSDLIQIPAGGARQRSTGVPASAADHFFQMSGREVFRLGVEHMTTAAQDAIKRSGLAYDEIDFFVPHQANRRISDTVAKHLDFDQDKVLSNIETVGNTAAASIPVLLAEAAADGRLRAGHRLLLVAFGGGLTWGAATMTWPDITSDTGYLAPAQD
jgi:3-oxoacyl-[acyl-carrier-protein] synthase-3